MNKIVKVARENLRLLEGYAYLVEYKEAIDIFSKKSDAKCCLMNPTVLAWHLTSGSICSEIISVKERIYNIDEFMKLNPDIDYYRWEGFAPVF